MEDRLDGVLPELPEGTTPEDIMRLVQLAEALSAEMEALIIQRSTSKGYGHKEIQVDPDADRPVAREMLGDDDMQAGAVGEVRVDERAGQVDPAAAGPKHQLDQVVDLRFGEDGDGELGTTGLGDEDPARLVDPDLLHLWVVEERLQRSHADDPVGDRLGDLGQVEQEWQVGGVAAFLVLGDEVADGGRVAVGRVEAAAADQLAYLALDDLVGGLVAISCLRAAGDK